LKIVVDTNIVFSCLINTESRIGQMLIWQNSRFEFYSCRFLLIELEKHKARLMKLTRLEEPALYELQ
jgi:predicted nucleic acid-binding protein